MFVDSSIFILLNVYRRFSELMFVPQVEGTVKYEHWQIMRYRQIAYC